MAKIKKRKRDWTKREKRKAINRILWAVSNGHDVKAAIERDPRLPSLRTWWNWLDRDTSGSLVHAYSRARERLGDVFGFKVVDLARRVEAGTMEPNRARVAILGYQWAAGRLAPRLWGDHRTLDVNLKEHHVKEIRLIDGRAPALEDMPAEVEQPAPKRLDPGRLADMHAVMDATRSGTLASLPLPGAELDEPTDPLGEHDAREGTQGEVIDAE